MHNSFHSYVGDEILKTSEYSFEPYERIVRKRVRTEQACRNYLSY